MGIQVVCPYCNRTCRFDKEVVYRKIIKCNYADCRHILASNGREVIKQWLQNPGPFLDDIKAVLKKKTHVGTKEWLFEKENLG